MYFIMHMHSIPLNARNAVLPSRLGSDEQSWSADGSINAENYQRGRRAAPNKNLVVDTVRLRVVRGTTSQL